MFPHLLEHFLKQECNEHVRSVLEAALDDNSKLRAHFDFNISCVTIEHPENMVVLEDAIGLTDEGPLRLPIAEFREALKRWTTISGGRP